MAMSVAMMLVDCNAPGFDIYGSGLSPDDLKIVDSKGVEYTFLVQVSTPYYIRLVNFTPSIFNDTYTVKYKDRALYTSVMVCPPPELSGIYTMDATRTRMQDFYNDFNKKIPDPTIRTALLGE
jgi:hypothetical protein